MQKSDFLTQLIEPARAKILRLFILYDTEQFSLLEIAKRTATGERVAAREVAALQAMGVVKELAGDGKNVKERKAATRYSFDARFKYANVLSAFIHEVSPERFNDVEKALRATGKLSVIVLSGVFTGDCNRPADILLVGDRVNETRLEKVVKSLEPKYGREIRYAVFSTPEFRYRLTIHDRLVRDTLDYPHRLLLNKNNLV